MRAKYLLVLTLVCLINPSWFAEVCIADTPATIRTPRGSVVPGTWFRDEMTQAEIDAGNAYVVLVYPLATILSDASRTYNCHGYAWHVSEGGERVWIGVNTTTAEDVYWEDGSYYEVGDASKAEKVSYAANDHSAVTTSTAGVFRSKWGELPLMQHTWDYCPIDYGRTLKYYRQNRGTIAYVLDRSGSMSGLPLLFAKIAANIGITLMKLQDEVAVVSFSSTASVNYPLTRIADNSGRQAARSAVNSLSAGGTTSIGAGLLAACAQLTNSNSAKRDYVLLSDGMQNTPPTPEEALNSPCFRNLIPAELADVNQLVQRVHTIAYGLGADQQLLAEIANRTGGIFLFVPSRNEPLALTDLFLTIREEITDEQRMGSSGGDITAPDEQAVPFTVSSDIAEETISLVWDDVNADLDLELERPDGTPITAGNASSYPGVVCVGGPAIEYFTLTPPDQGNWTVHVKAVSGAASFALVFTAQSSIRMNIFFDQPEYPIGGSILVSASLAEGGTPITGATVTVQVMTPTTAALERASDEREGGDDARNDLADVHASEDGGSYVDEEGTVLFVVTDLTLLDDGAHGDGAANDGVYADHFTDTNVQGTYSFHVAASGQAPSGVSFTREASKATVISATANQPPIADAGSEQTVECASSTGSDVTLNGSGSSDPDGDSLTYTWEENGNIIAGPTGDAQLIVSLGLGSHTIQLVVQDSRGATDTDDVLVTVADTTPPDIMVSLNRDVLWPPNHKMVDMTADVTVTDNCCPSPTFKLVSITSDEPDDGKGDGDTIDDIQGADLGTADLEFNLRSERSGKGDGRIYTIVYSAEDCVGNAVFDTVAVRVPHDHSGTALASLGYAADGSDLDRSLESFVLVIPSRGSRVGTEETGGSEKVLPPFDATTLDPTRTYIGNTAGVIRPLRSIALDNDRDGLVDLALFYPSEEAVKLLRNSSTVSGDALAIDGEGVDGPVGLHYIDGHGVDYLVRDVFALGSPVPLNLPANEKWDAHEQGSASLQNRNEPLPEEGDLNALLPSYPNPFNPSTTIPFTLVAEERGVLRIYDAGGRLVRTLLDAVVPAGRHDVPWDGRGQSGNPLATGIYFVRLQAGSFEATRKIVILR